MQAAIHDYPTEFGHEQDVYMSGVLTRLRALQDNHNTSDAYKTKFLATLREAKEAYARVNEFIGAHPHLHMNALVAIAKREANLCTPKTGGDKIKTACWKAVLDEELEGRLAPFEV